MAIIPIFLLGHWDFWVLKCCWGFAHKKIVGFSSTISYCTIPPRKVTEEFPLPYGMGHPLPQ
jgi:hypothetical protein